jgi:hypothetical protein
MKPLLVFVLCCGRSLRISLVTLSLLIEYCPLSASPQAVSLLEEVITPRKDLPPLLLKLNERPAEHLDYLGVSYGLTPRLLK